MLHSGKFSGRQETCFSPVARRSLSIRGLAIVLAFAAFIPSAVSQQPQAPGEDFRLRVETDLVVLHATVTDKDGKPVADLTQENFQVLEDGKAQILKIFKREDIPVSVGIVVDNSGSMRDKRKGVNAAALKFVQSSNPNDEVFIVNFNEEAFLDADFTDNMHLLEEALERIDARGGTALYDALDMSLQHMTERSTLDKKVLIAVTDGEDNASRISLEQIVREVEKSNVMIYTVGLLGGENDRVMRRAKRALENISRATGANVYFPKGPNDVLGVATQIANEIRNQYVLAYTPSNLAGDNRFRKVEVKVNAPKRGKLNVRTRTGYYPNSPPSETSSNQSEL
jgi:VWFA-related protein